MKRILLIGNFLSNSKFNPTVIEDLANRFDKMGLVVLTTSRKKNKFNRLFDIIKTILFKKINYDFALIEVYSGLAFIWAFFSGFLLRLLKKPFILVLHGGNLPQFSKIHPRLVRKLFLWPGRIVSPSHFLKEKLNHFSFNIDIIPNPIELKNYRFKHRKNVESNFIWLRAFHEIYNPSLVPKVVSILSKDIPDLKVVMVGPDKGDGSLQRMIYVADKLGISNLIEIVQGVSKDQVPKMLNLSDIFINTTNIDNTPVSVIEAMACGLCIISTNIGGIPYLLENEKDAMLVPPDDPEAMAAAIQRILDDSELAARLSTNARKKAEQYDWSLIFPKWEKLIQELLTEFEKY